MLKSLRIKFILYRLPITAALLLVILSFTPMRFLAMIGAIIFWAIYWPFGKSLSSILLRLALAFILTTCVVQLAGFGFWVLHIHFTVPAGVVIELIPPCLVLNKRRPIINIFNRNDVAALLIAIASMIILLWSGLHGGPLLQQLVRQSTTGYDGVQHISLTMSLYDNQGYLYGHFPKLANKIIYNNLASYPQGWSLSTSLWWHALTSNLSVRLQPAKVLLLYFSFLSLWFGVLVFLFCRLTLKLIEVIRGVVNGGAEVIGGLMFTLLAELMVLIGVPYNSFVSFYPALVFPLALTLFIIELLDDRDKRVKRSPAVFLISSLLLSGGVAFSWLLAAPGAYVMVLIALLIYFNGSLKSGLKWLFNRKQLLLIVIVILAFSSGQGIVQLKYGVKGLVNYPGTAGVLHSLVLFSLLIITLIGVSISNNIRIKNIFTSAVAGIFAISGLVYLYQLATVGQANYFSTKITFVAFTLIAAFSAAFIISAISDHITVNNGFIVKSLLLIGIVLFIPVSSNMDLGTSTANGIGPINYMQGKRFLAEYSASQISGLLMQKKIYNSNLIVYKHLNYSEDVITTHFDQMLSRKAISSCNEKILGNLISQWNISPQQVIKCSDGRDYYIITSASTYASLKESFISAPNIKLLLSN